MDEAMPADCTWITPNLLFFYTRPIFESFGVGSRSLFLLQKPVLKRSDCEWLSTSREPRSWNDLLVCSSKWIVIQSRWFVFVIAAFHGISDGWMFYSNGAGHYDLIPFSPCPSLDLLLQTSAAAQKDLGIERNGLKLMLKLRPVRNYTDLGLECKASPKNVPLWPNNT